MSAIAAFAAAMAQLVGSASMVVVLEMLEPPPGLFGCCDESLRACAPYIGAYEAHCTLQKTAPSIQKLGADCGANGILD